MLYAERRAREGRGLIAPGSEPASDLTESTGILPSKDVPVRWMNGVLPIFTVIIVTIIGVWYTGHKAVVASGQEITLRTILSNASSFTALFWSSLSGCAVGILLSVGQRILSLHDAMEAWFSGVKSMLLAMVILTLAWSICGVTKELGTAEYIVKVLKGTLPLWSIPALTFTIAAFISFATGTSWGTMAILMPLIVPLAWNMSLDKGLDPIASQHALFLAVSAVLAGSIWGDHCSPISDTTVMSSMASSCDHIDHVRTQMPYALVVGGLSIALYLPAAFGLNTWVLLGISVLILALIIFLFGRRVEIKRNSR
jgi:Na+/H+ antiporter NhaC